MRVVSWNCAGQAARKIGVLLDAQPDLIILSEAERDAASDLDEKASGRLWIGGPTKRGLAVIALNGWRLEPVGVEVTERLFLPFLAKKGSAVVRGVGACVKKTTDYVTPTLSALNQLEGFLREGPSIFAGDFNQTVILDKKRSPARRYRRVLERFEDMRYRSAWHSARGELMGEETAPTLFYRWKDTPGNRFHIDYLFLSEELRVGSASLGNFADFPGKRLSDHVPLYVELKPVD